MSPIFKGFSLSPFQILTKSGDITHGPKADLFWKPLVNEDDNIIKLNLSFCKIYNISPAHQECSTDCCN